MSATEKAVCGPTISYPSNVGNCVTSTMPVSEDMECAKPSSTTDCNGGTNGVSKDIGLHFTQTLVNLKALNNGQFGNDEKKVINREEDIVILDHTPSSDTTPKPTTTSTPSLFPASLLPKPPISLAESIRQPTSTVYEPPKTNKFEINDRVRSSFKDIMSKIQENTPSLQNLLAKTKDLDTRERKEERERLEREQQAAKALGKGNGDITTMGKNNGEKATLGKGSGDNVFENLKVLNCDTSCDEEKPVSKPVEQGSSAISIKPPTSSNDNSKEHEVILLDDVEVDLQAKTVESSMTTSEKEVIKSDLTEATNTIQDCDNSNNVQSSVPESSRSPICIDIDNSLKSDAPEVSESSSTLKGSESSSTLKGSESSSTLRAEEELLKIDLDSSSDVKKDEEEMGTNEEEERLLASDSDDDKTKEVIREDKDQQSTKSAEKMETDRKAKEDDSVVIEMNNDTCEVKIEDNGNRVDSEEKNVTLQVKIDESVKIAKGEESNIDVKQEGDVTVKLEKDDKDLVKKEVKMEVDEDSQSSSSSSDSNTSSKSSQGDVKVKKEMETEIKSEQRCASPSESSDRKRPADSLTVSGQPKRSRLDMVIGKLGSAIGIQPDSLEDVPDEEMSDVEESHESEVTGSVKSEDTSSSVSEDEDDSQDSPTKKTKVKRHRIRLTESELEQIVRTKVKMYMKVERDERYKELQEKVEELTQNVDFWKSNYRELERQVLNVTILQQKHEKRKAKTAALRELSTKNVAVQVDENKTNHMNQLGQQTTPTKPGNQTPSKTPTKMTTGFQAMHVKSPNSGGIAPNLAPPHTSVVLSNNTVPPKLTPMTVTKISQSSVTSGSACLVQSLATTATSNTLTKNVLPLPNDRTVKTLLDNKRMVMPATKLMGASPPVSGLIPVLVATSQQANMLTRTPILNKPSNTLAISTPGQSKAGDVVDLTGEEDTGMKRYSTPAASTSLVTGGVPQGNPVTTVQTGGLVPQQVLRPTVPNQPQGVANNSGILLSTPAGTQIMRNPQQTFQLVFNSTSPAIRPGSLLTVMQGPNGNNQIIRPMMTTTSGQPPQLRAAATIQPPIQRTNITPKNVTPSNVKMMTRPPPPLQVAPSSLQVVPPVKPAPPPKAPEHHHPAPLPVAPADQVKPGQKPLPPKPTLKISRVSQGIVLSWNMTLNQTPHADVASYQLFAYQESSTHPTTALWKKVGDVKALPLPMACTLTQFQEGNRYHFAVRAVDVHTRVGPFSEPNTIHLTSKKD